MPPVIRPFNPPVLPTTQPRAQPSPDARAAQRAFFQQAVGDTTPASALATVASVAQGRAVEPVVTRLKTQPIPDEKPTRYMRPGSFLDIKV